MPFEIDPLFGFGLRRNVTCDQCGAARFSSEVPPFVRARGGEVAVTIRLLGVCGECYTVLCDKCAPRTICPRCRVPLLSPDHPPTPPPWRRFFKRLKWNRVFG